MFKPHSLQVLMIEQKLVDRAQKYKLLIEHFLLKEQICNGHTFFLHLDGETPSRSVNILTK